MPHWIRQRRLRILLLILLGILLLILGTRLRRNRTNVTGVSSPTTNEIPTTISVASSSNSAAFVMRDITTQGSWKTVYGADGYNIIEASENYPAYAQVKPIEIASLLQTASTNDVRALQKPAPTATDRMAGTWWHPGSFSVELNLTDGQPHRVALYALDLGRFGRVQTVDILDASNKNVLDSRSTGVLDDGVWLIWDIRGHVIIRLTNTGGARKAALLHGIFFQPPDDTKAILPNVVSFNSTNEFVPTLLNPFTGSVEIAKSEPQLTNAAPVNAAAKQGLTPLHIAASVMREDLVKSLLSAGDSVTATNVNGWTPLHIAAEQGSVAISKLLLDRGADVNARDKSGWTPLYFGLWSKPLTLLLLNGGAELNATNNTGSTPLHWAAVTANDDIIKLLISRGAELEAHDRDGLTPLQRAVRERRTDAMKTLLADGADIQAGNAYTGDTALHYAAYNDDQEVIRLLLSKRAAIGATNNAGDTSLHVAAGRGKKDSIKLLVERGANPNAPDIRGLTPLHIAVIRNELECVKLLISSGAIINIVDKAERTPLDWALQVSKPDMIEYLKKQGAK